MPKFGDYTATTTPAAADELLLKTAAGTRRVTVANMAAAGALVDTAANLASSNPTPVAGRVVLAYDTDVLAVADGTTAWNSLPKYRPEAAPVVLTSTTQQTGISTTITDLTGLTGLQFTVGSQPWEVELWCPWVTASAVDHTAMLYIRTSADVTVQQSPVYCGGVSGGLVNQGRCKVTVTAAGSYNYKGSIQKSVGAGTVGNGADLASLTATLIARPLAA